MRKALLLLMILMTSVYIVLAQSDYYIKKAQSYQREAEYYQKKADGYRDNAEYYLKRAEKYQRDAAYYTKRGDLDRAKTYSRYAENVRWISMKHNCDMQLRLMIRQLCIFVGLRMH